MESTEPQVDRTSWPLGPWDFEGDREEWKTAAGLPGLMVRNRQGSWCGYAAVPPGHPYHGKGYDDVDVDAHGGLTYADSCGGNIFHVPEPGEPDDVWWLGFDCAHYTDLSPGMMASEMKYGFPERELLFPVPVYRDEAYVRAEVEQLAAQLVAASS